VNGFWQPWISFCLLRCRGLAKQALLPLAVGKLKDDRLTLQYAGRVLFLWLPARHCEFRCTLVDNVRNHELHRLAGTIHGKDVDVVHGVEFQGRFAFDDLVRSFDDKSAIGDREMIFAPKSIAGCERASQLVGWDCRIRTSTRRGSGPGRSYLDGSEIVTLSVLRLRLTARLGLFRLGMSSIHSMGALHGP